MHLTQLYTSVVRVSATDREVVFARISYLHACTLLSYACEQTGALPMVEQLCILPKMRMRK